jgi:ADP-ribosylglycohydrolase
MDINKYNEDLVKSAEIKIPIEDEEDWTQSQSQKITDSHIRTLWYSHAPGSGAPASVLAGAIQAMTNLGYDTSEAKKVFFETKDSKDITELSQNLSYIFHLLNNAPKDSDNIYWKYKIYESWDDCLEDIDAGSIVKVESEEKTFYGWLGQIAAGAFGTALEGYDGKRIRDKYEKLDNYLKPVSTYNDDLTFQIALMAALEKHGKELSSIDIANEWAGLIPFAWSAEDIALKNLRLGIYPPESGYRSNPYREWIGAQMRGSICGMLYPGKPLKAAELAYKDGVVSHHNNGVLGEVYNAVMTSIAYYAKDIEQVVTEAMEYIPRKSQYYYVINKAYEIAKSSEDYVYVLEMLGERFARYNLVHAYPNIAIEIAAMVHGKGDFDKTLELIGMAGLDVDCNAAQVGNILGVLNSKVPDKWIEPLKGKFKTYVRRYEEISIREITDWTLKLAKDLR